MFCRIRISIAIIFVTLIASPVFAEGFYFGGDVGLAFYSLNDLNDEIDAINSLAGGDYLDNITKGAEFGLFLGYQVNPKIGIGLGYSRLNGSTSYSDFSGSIKYDVPANLYLAHFNYLPANEKSVRVGFGADAGLISSAGSIDLAISGEVPINGDFTGSGPAFAGYMLVDFKVGTSASLIANAGYRYATIGSPKVNGNDIMGTNGGDYTLDYNGVFIRVGIRVSP